MKKLNLILSIKNLGTKNTWELYNGIMASYYKCLGMYYASIGDVLFCIVSYSGVPFS